MYLCTYVCRKNYLADVDVGPERLVHMDNVDIDVLINQCSDSLHEESFEDEVGKKIFWVCTCTVVFICTLHVAVVNLEVKEDDFWPFPSKEFALLYFIQHSPNPLMCVYILYSRCVYTYSVYCKVNQISDLYGM